MQERFLFHILVLFNLIIIDQIKWLTPNVYKDMYGLIKALSAEGMYVGTVFCKIT